MKLNLHNVFYILFTSSIIGLIVNALNPEGIPLIRKEKEVVWADSLKILNEKSKADSIHIDLKSIPPDSLISKIKTENAKTQREKKDEDKKEDQLKEPAAVKLGQAYQLYNNGAVFLDARDNLDFKEGHIKGAVSLPYYEFDNYKNALDKISKKDLIVTYCAGTDCDLSIMLGRQLLSLGYQNVYIFFGGWNDWINDGYPVELLKENL